MLTTDRLVLRELVEDDWPAVHEYATDIEVMRFIRYRVNETPEETRAFIARAVAKARAVPRVEYELAVTLKDGKLIGACTIWFTDVDSREGEIGYALDRNYWRQGYGSELARALVRFGFTDLGMHRITARCNAENVASARVMERCGMTYEGRMRERIWGLDRWWDELRYAILEHEWIDQ